MKEYQIDRIKITDKPMVRDMKSKAVVSADQEGLQAYRDRRAAMDKMMNTTDEVQGLKEEINTLKNDVTEIKELLLRLVNK